jgi:hypothetical protein
MLKLIKCTAIISFLLSSSSDILNCICIHNIKGFALSDLFVFDYTLLISDLDSDCIVDYLCRIIEQLQCIKQFKHIKITDLLRIR